MAGLASAFTLADLEPLLLEQSPRFGGNAQGERWNGISYSIGAAYLVKPEPDSELSKAFYGPLGVDKEWRLAPEDEVALGSSVCAGFWQGATDPARKEEFQKAAAYFRRVLDQSYPDLPTVPDGALSEAQLLDLDRKSFREELELQLGKLHPHIETLIEHYSWSSFGGSIRELGAASGLDFFAAEFQGICALPGGNSRVAERLLEVLAIPKFVSKAILVGAAQDQLDAMAQVRYHSYLVANALLEVPAPARSLDLYLLGDGTVGTDAQVASDGQGITDVIAGHWAQGGHPNSSVLSLYRAYPWDGARYALYENDSLAGVKQEMTRQLPSILRLFGLQPDQVKELRVARWGHALPLAEKGFLASGVWAKARRPIGGRIFFAEQDNGPAPAIETSLTEALRAAEMVRKALA